MADAADRGRHLPEALPGHYRIVSELGAGGMGRVFKAIDTRLNRPVAIKAMHQARLEAGGAARLRTEALAAASLDHPYLCKIYELIEDRDDTLIVMEFVEGETLAAKLQRGLLPIQETVRLASELAEGLANAHQHGLVHRDVKPSNVMVTPSGHVKLLDFGLARPDVASPSAAETHTSPGGRADYGGTPQYMAPEQATGAAVTARADLFALGVLIFECLTGRLPFDGTTGYDYVRHMLSEAPRPLHRIAPSTPDALVRVVEDCLEKVPARRPESAAEVRTELRRIADALAAPDAGLTTARAARASKRWRTVALAGVLVAVTLIALWKWMPPRDGDVVRRLVRLTTSPGQEVGSRLSPNGEWVAFIARRAGTAQLFVQQVDGNEEKQVTLPTGWIVSHVWSPDGNQLACLVWQGDDLTLLTVPAFFGGVPLRSVAVGRAPHSGVLLRWIGQSIYAKIETAGGDASLQRIDLDRGGGRTDLSSSWKVADKPVEFDVRPDGLQVAFTMVSAGQFHIWVANPDGTAATRLVDDEASFDRYPLWSARGDRVIFQSNRGGQVDLWEMTLATRKLTALTTSPDIEVPESTSADGSVTFQQVSEHAVLWTSNHDGGDDRQLTSNALSDIVPSSSADGRMLVFQRRQSSPKAGTFMFDSQIIARPLDMSGALAREIKIGNGFAPRLSPDGSHAAYFQRTDSIINDRLVVVRLESQEATVVSSTCSRPRYVEFPDEFVDRNLSWNGAGETLFFVNRLSGFTLQRYRLGASAPEPLTASETPDPIYDVSVSTDGHKVAYLTRSATTAALHVLDLDSNADQVLAMLSYEVAYARSGWPSLRGWTRDDAGLVLVRPTEVNDDASHTVEIRIVQMDHKQVQVGVYDHVIRATARFVSATSDLYMTRRSPGGLFDVYAVSIPSGRARAVTRNSNPDVKYAGVEPLGLDRVVTVRDEQKTDISLLDARPASKRPVSPAARRP